MSFVNILYIIGYAGLFICVAWKLWQMYSDQKKKNVELQREIKQKQYDIERIISYFGEIKKIQRSEANYKDKIKEAKSDEEVFCIISDIINNNNVRVQDSQN